jgi:hypothetical protein
LIIITCLESRLYFCYAPAKIQIKHAQFLKIRKEVKNVNVIGPDDLCLGPSGWPMANPMGYMEHC